LALGARRVADPAVAGVLLIQRDDAAAVEPSTRRPQRRVAPDPPHELARRRGGERLLRTESAEEGRPTAESAASRGARRPPPPPYDRPRSLATADQARLPASAARRRRVEAYRSADRRRSAGPRDDVPDRARLSPHRRLRRLVRPDPDSARLVSGPIRAAERARTWSVLHPLRPALATPRNLQRRIHVHRRPQRILGQRPHERAARGRARHARWLPKRTRRHPALERRPERTRELRVGTPKPAAHRLERQTESGAEQQLGVGF